MGQDQLSIFGADDKPPASGKTLGISVSKTINGNTQKVFDHWLIPVFVGEWMFGPQHGQEKIVSLVNKVRKGGAFSYTVKQKNKEIVFSGSYLELDIPKRLVFTWTDSQEPNYESQITALFQEDGDKTRLKLSIKLPVELEKQKDKVKQQWASRCTALAEKFKK